MIDRIRHFFETSLSPVSSTPNDLEYRLRLASAALLIEVARADVVVKAEEMTVISSAVRTTFGLSMVESDELVQLAETEASDATSYYPFISLINAHYDKAQKVQLLELLWEVVYADAVLEKYEEYLVRKLAELLYVPHSQFIATKLRVLERLQGNE